MFGGEATNRADQVSTRLGASADFSPKVSNLFFDLTPGEAAKERGGHPFPFAASNVAGVALVVYVQLGCMF